MMEINETILKMAMAQTLLDTIELLMYLRAESSSAHHSRIDDMIQRLTTMGMSLQ